MSDKNIIVAECISGEFEIYDGKAKKIIDKEEFKILKKKNLVTMLARKREKMTIEECYEFFNKSAEELLKENKMINLYKSCSFADSAQFYWKIMLKNKNIITEPMTKLEENILKEIKSSIIFSDKNYKGCGYKYDIVSSYSSIMQDAKFLVPCRKPKELTIKKLVEATYQFGERTYLKYGLYHCKISQTNVEKTDRLFKFQDNDWYTSIDIELAKLLKLKLKMIDDGKSNLLFYGRDIGGKSSIETGKTIFAEYVHKIFDLKEKRITGAKNLLTCLWGIFCQKNTRIVKDNKKNKEINKCLPCNDGTTAFSIEQEQLYKSPFARFVPFLYAQGRFNLITKLLKYKEHIVYAHTDGFISKVKLDIQCGANLGDLRYEGYIKDVYVINSNDVRGVKNIIKNEKEDKEAKEWAESEKEFYQRFIKPKNSKK